MWKKKGFTLIELMLVVVILGILMTMVIPRMVGRSEQARKVAAQADIEANIATALDLYQLDNRKYPTTEQGLGALLKKTTTPPVPQYWNGPYIKRKFPRDPWDNPYVYVCPGIHNSQDYDLFSYGADGVEGGGDDITNWDVEQE
jgi:general secretion pathway protein G